MHLHTKNCEYDLLYCHKQPQKKQTVCCCLHYFVFFRIPEQVNKDCGLDSYHLILDTYNSSMGCLVDSFLS